MKNINNYAPVKCSKNIVISAERKIVWQTLTDVDNWSSWQTDVSKSKLNGELISQSTFEWKSGGIKIHSTLHTVDPYNYFGWTGKTLGMSAIHNWILWDKDGKTMVQVEESIEGFLAILFKKTFNNNLELGMEKWLELLKQKCESHTRDE